MLQKWSYWRVASAFFKQPSKALSVAEISRDAKLAQTSVRLHLTELEATGLIERDEHVQGKRTYPVFKARHETAMFREQKILYNLDEMRVLTKKLSQLTGARTIILFGSYRYGEDVEISDIDLFIDAPKTTIDLHEHEKRLQRRIQLHFGDARKISGTMRQTLINGIVLYGTLNVA